MIKLTYVEDYLELLAGHRSIATGRPSGTISPLHLVSGESPLKLARYDVNVLLNMVLGVQNNIALTERQAPLACKIILKYHRQWKTLGVDVSPVQTPVYRLPIRKLNYSKTVSLTPDGQSLSVRFPFIADRVTEIREFSKISQGSAHWHTDRFWKVALTEFNLNWLVCWASTHQFDIDPQVTALFALITAAEQQTPPLTLCVSDSGDLYITDAPDSLSCHIVDQGLTMEMNSILPVLDKCAELGVIVSTDALTQAKLQHPAMSKIFWDLCLIRDCKTTETECIPEIFNYADQMQRWPVVIYEPDASHTLLQWLLANYPPQHIANAQHSESWDADARYIYTKKPLRNIDTIPLLISTAGMIHGPEKILMWRKARKIVYTVPEVYYTDCSDKVKFIAS